jgi:hypothetical protein
MTIEAIETLASEQTTIHDTAKRIVELLDAEKAGADRLRGDGEAARNRIFELVTSNANSLKAQKVDDAVVATHDLPVYSGYVSRKMRRYGFVRCDQIPAAVGFPGRREGAGICKVIHSGHCHRLSE